MGVRYKRDGKGVEGEIIEQGSKYYFYDQESSKSYGKYFT